MIFLVKVQKVKFPNKNVEFIDPRSCHDNVPSIFPLNHWAQFLQVKLNNFYVHLVTFPVISAIITECNVAVSTCNLEELKIMNYSQT